MKKFYGGICLDLYEEIPREYRDVLSIGKNVIIGTGCVLAGNGFGYEKVGKVYKHKEHKRKLIINDGVSIHYNCVIDRGRVRNTVIGAGTKIDSGVHIAHGVQIGKNCIIGSGARILGSVTIADNSTVWAGAIINQGVKIGTKCIVGAGSYIRHDVPDNKQVFISNGVPKYKHLN